MAWKKIDHTVGCAVATPGEAAAYLGIAVKTLSKKVKRGHIPAIRFAMMPKTYRILWNVLVAIKTCRS